MPEHDDLELLELPRPRTKEDELQEATDDEIRKRPGQRTSSSPEAGGSRLYDRRPERTELAHPARSPARRLQQLRRDLPRDATRYLARADRLDEDVVQHAAYLAALQSAATYTTDGSRLELHTKSGATAVDLERR